MAKCPNINSEEWKTLVNEKGELEAYAIYIENGYEIPVANDIEQLDVSTPITSDQEQSAEALRDVTAVRQKILNALITKYNIYEGGKNEEYVQSLKKLINDFAEADVRRSMVLFIQNAESTMSSLEKRIHKEKDNLELLKILSDFAGSYSMIEDVVSAMNNYPPGTFKNFQKRADSILGRVSSFNKTYANYARETLANRLAAESTKIRAQEKEAYERKYRTDFPKKESGLSSKEYLNKQREYVQKMLNENRDSILRKEKRYVKELLKVAPKDIGDISRMLIDPRGVNDHTIQLAVKLLDTADQLAKEDFLKDRAKAMGLWRKFTAGKQGAVITDQKKLYEGIIEKIDGKETQYYVRPLYSTFYENRSNMWREYHKLKDEGKTLEAKKLLREWKSKYLVTSKGDARQDDLVKPEFRNPQYSQLSGAKKEMYDFLVQFNKESDAMLHGRSKIGYRLPSLTKEFGEKITDRGIKTAGLESVKETFSMRSDDWQYGDFTKEDDVIRVLTDQHGKALKRIAVPFRAEIDVKDQSYDLMGMALTNRFVSRNYKEKLAIKNDLEVLKDLMAERKVNLHKGGRKVLQTVKDVLGVGKEEASEIAQSIEGDQSKSFQLMESLLEDRLYGRHNISSTVGNVSLDKVANFAAKLSAHNMLIANALGGTANVLNGKTMNFFEATRRVHYDRKDLLSAEAKYMSDVPKVIADYGMLTPSAKTNLLIEKFLDTSMDFSGLSNNLLQDTRVKNFFDVKTLHGINGAAEHYIQGTLIYAALNNIKVQNKSGQYIDKNGKATKDRSRAMSMDEAYTKGENGLLEWSNKEWTIEGFDEFDQKAEIAVNRKIKDITADLQGNYDSVNRAHIQRYWYGKLAFFLRKWMVRGMQRRWRGIDNYNKDLDGIELHDRFYSESSESFKEGTYTSALRFINAIKSDLVKLRGQAMATEWNKLSDLERANIRSATAELSVMVASLAAANLLAGLAKGADDEDDKARLYTAAYLMRRQYGELLTFTPMGISGEGIRTLRTPTATISTIELTLNTTAQLFDDLLHLEFEEYGTGRHKGERKSWVLMNKVFNPFYKNWIDRDAERSLKFLTGVTYK